MIKTTDNIKKSLINETDKALKTSDNILKLIKDFKKSMMKEYLMIDADADILKEYKAAFASSSLDIVKLKDIIAPDGIIEGPRDESFYSESYSEAGVTVILPSHIKNLRFTLEAFKHVSHNALSAYSKYLVKGGDIIMRNDIADKGASALIPFMNEDSILGPNVIRIRVNSKLCEVFYILNVLHFYYNVNIMNYILDESKADPISEIIIPLPPIEKQKQIADSMLQLSAGIIAHENYCKEIHKLGLLTKDQ